MDKSKILVVLLVFTYVLFVIFEFSGNNKELATQFESLIVPLVALRYFLFVKRKNVFFTMFLVFFAVSDLIALLFRSVLFEITSPYYEYAYYICNPLYVLAYFMLFFMLCKSINFKYIFNNLKIHLLVLIILDAYLIYVLHAIEKPTIKTTIVYLLENTYNIIILVVLATALLNYFYRDNEKALFLFFGVLCIVFSEVIDVANIYISESNLLNFLATTLVLGAFYFFYEQAKLSNDKSRGDKNYSYLH
jgi:hypothetical protein